MAESGFPDFRQYPQWRADFKVGNSVTVTSSSGITITDYATANASTLLHVLLDSGTGVTVTITFYTDDTEAHEIATWTYVLNSNIQLNSIIPNLGNYLVVTISTGQTGNQVVTWRTQQTNVAVSTPSYPVATNYGGNYDFTIAAGNTFTFTFPQVQEGNGRVTVNPHSGGGAMTVTVYDTSESGAERHVLQRSYQPGGPVSLPFLAGKNPVTVSIYNGSSVANNYDYGASVLSR